MRTFSRGRAAAGVLGVRRESIKVRQPTLPRYIKTARTISEPMQTVDLALVKNGAMLTYYVNGEKAFETTQNDFMYNVYAGFYVDKANAVFSDYAASAYSSDIELLQLAK